jgi:hypothetical protein
MNGPQRPDCVALQLPRLTSAANAETREIRLRFTCLHGCQFQAVAHDRDGSGPRMHARKVGDHVGPRAGDGPQIAVRQLASPVRQIQ